MEIFKNIIVAQEALEKGPEKTAIYSALCAIIKKDNCQFFRKMKRIVGENYVRHFFLGSYKFRAR